MQDPTKNQFTGYYSTGAVVSPAIERANSLNPGATLAENAENLDLPRSSDGEYRLTFAASGKGIMSAQPSILFGGIIGTFSRFNFPYLKFKWEGETRFSLTFLYNCC